MRERGYRMSVGPRELDGRVQPEQGVSPFLICHRPKGDEIAASMTHPLRSCRVVRRSPCLRPVACWSSRKVQHSLSRQRAGRVCTDQGSQCVLGLTSGTCSPLWCSRPPLGLRLAETGKRCVDARDTYRGGCAPSSREITRRWLLVSW